MNKKGMFEERYKTGVTPWELERPDSNLMDIVKKENIKPCKALEIGCGTGSNAIWLAQNGFEFIFDRGCFHSFDEKEDRIIFARKVSLHLKEGGRWFSILGNADDAPRDEGPPMRSALEIITAVESYCEILSLVSAMFDSNREKTARCWKCLMRKR